jgi:ABC-type multidrug transport system permease subunit
MKDSSFLLYILIIHYLADFVLQTVDQSKLKSTDNRMLAYHVATYSFVWLFASYIIYEKPAQAIAFAAITFIFHFATDWATSRIGKKFWEKSDYHNGFNVVGFDQILHYVQLYATFSLI